MKKTFSWALLLSAIGLMGYSPDADLLSRLQQQLKTFYESKDRVRVHLVLHQPEYAVGDTVYFKAHLFQGPGRKAFWGRQVLNIQLVDRQKKVLLYNKMLIRDGIVAGQFKLPEKLTPGLYAVIAYSDGGSESVHPLISQTSLVVANEKQWIQSPSPIGIFPEGGRLVIGLRTRVVVRTPKGNSTARVIDSAGALLQEFSTNANGVGSFFLTPEANRQYVLESPFGKKDLPATEADGASLMVEPGASHTMHVTVEVPVTSLFRKEELYAVLTTQGTIGFSKVLSFQKETVAKFTIPEITGQEGVALLTIFNGHSEVLNERIVFLRASPLDVAVSLDAPQYQVRKPVMLDVAIKELNGLPASANFSVTVYKESLFPASNDAADFDKHVLLLDDLIPDFSIVPSLENESELCEYLVSRRWGGFKWSEVLDQKEEKAQKAPSAFYFRGKVVSAKGGSIPDSTKITFYLNKNDFVYVVYTKNKGEFAFPLFMDFHSDELLYRIYYHGRENKDAFVVMPETPAAPWDFPDVIAGKETDPYSAFVNSSGPVVKSFQYYLSKPGAAGHLIESEYPEIDDVDVQADVEKYKKFNSMAEVLVEVVPALRYRKADNHEVVRVFLKEKAMFAQDDPLYFIDGVITDSTGYFLGLDPSHLKRIKLLRSERTLSRFGDLGKYGIVVVESHSPEIPASIPRSKRSLFITGITAALPSYSPNYKETTASLVPDLRSTLCWQPSNNLDSEGRGKTTFYTGDATGNFLVRVDGVTKEGRPFTKWTKFAVSLDRP